MRHISFYCNLHGIFFLRRIFLLTILFICQIGYAQSSLSNDRFIVENEYAKAVFDYDSGQLFYLENKSNGLKSIADGQRSSFWEVGILSDGKEEILTIERAKDFVINRKGSGKIELVWSDFEKIQNKSLLVRVSIDFESISPQSKWDIEMKGLGEEQIEKIKFPIITLNPTNKFKKLVAPLWSGQLINLEDMESEKKVFQGDYPGQMSMQFLALYNAKKEGIYFATNDTLSFTKTFRFFEKAGNWRYELEQYPNHRDSEGMIGLKNSAIIGVFEGDWTAAATIYKEWGVKLPWAKQSRLTGENKKWVEQTGLWIWNRGKSKMVLKPAEQLAQKSDLPISVLWHWWHNGAYDDQFPDYFPPREGKDSFKIAIKESKAMGINTLVYMNSYQWGNATRSFSENNAEKWAVKDDRGHLLSHVYNIFTKHALTPMCVATNFWKDKYYGLVREAIENYNLSGIYMDQACISFKCYDASHDHAVGGGNYWVDNFGTLTQKIRTLETGDEEGIILAGEGASENWIPHLDAMLTLQVSQERYAGVDDTEPIPLFQFVYHPFAITFGNYSSLINPPYDELWPKEFKPKNLHALLDSKYNDQFLMEQARSYIWGMQPTLANYNKILFDKRSQEMSFLLRLARTRYNALKFLLYGELIDLPVGKNPPKKVIDISKLSIYAGREDRVTSFEKEIPLIYQSLWRAKDNTIGFAITNIDRDSHSISIDLDSEKLNLPTNGKISIIDHSGKKDYKSYENGKIKINLNIEALDAKIVEIGGD